MAKNSFKSALEEAEAVVLRLQQNMSEIDRTILSASKSARKLANVQFDSSSPRELNERLQQNVKYRKEASEQVEKQRLAEIKLQQAREKAFDEYEKKLQKEKADRERQVKAESELRQRLAKQKEQEQKQEIALNNKLAKQKEQNFKKEISLANKKSREDVRQVENQKLLARNAREHARISSRLATEYEKQSIVLTQLRRKYKDVAMTMGVNSKEARQLQREVSELDDKLKRVDASVGQHQRNVGNYGSAWSGVKDIIMSAVAAFGIYEAINIGKQIYRQIKEINALNNALKQVTETQTSYNQALEFVIGVSERAGTEINTLQKAYTKFYASAKETNLTLEETQYIFETIATVGGVMALSTEEINGALRAMEQMLSKGKIQAEEIRGQMGERLPGAFQILAKSMGLTTQELNKQLELGNVIAEEVLPGMAREYAKAYGLDNLKRVETLVASQTRLSNSWNMFIRELEEGNGFISRVLMGTFDGLAALINEISAGFNRLDTQLTVTGNYFGKLEEDLRGVASQSKIVTFQLNVLIFGLSALKKLLIRPMFEPLILGLKIVTAAVSSFSEAIKSAFTDTVEFVNYVKKGEFAKGFSFWGGTLTRVADSFTGAWSRAFTSIKSDTEKIQKEIDAFVAKNGSLAPLNKDQNFWDFTKIPLPEEETSETDQAGGPIDPRPKVEAMEVSRKAIKFSVEWFEQLIKIAKETQSQVSRTTEEYKKHGEEIQRLEKILDQIKNGPAIEIDDEQLQDLQDHLDSKIPAAMERLSDVTGQELAALMHEFSTWYEWDYNEFLKFSEKKLQQADQENEIKKEKLADWMRTASDVVYSVGNLFASISERNIQKIEDEIAAKDKLLESERLSEEQRKLIEKDKAKLEKRRQEEKVKAAKTEKAFAMFDIAINTASAVVQALPNIPLSIAIGVIGALQLATVASKPVPKYKHGRKSGKAEMAIVGDGGTEEVITDKDGNLQMVTPKTPTLTYLGEDHKVFPNFKSYFDSMDMDKLNKAAIMTSLNSQSRALNDRETRKSFDKEILKAIQEGNNKKQTAPPAPDYGRLAREFAKEMNFSRRRDV